MNYEIIYAKRKTLSLIVRDGKVLVRAPFKTSPDFIDHFVQSKATWIEKHLARYMAWGIDIESMERVILFGRAYDIELSRSESFSWNLDQKKLFIRAPETMSAGRINRLIEKDLQKELDSYIHLKIIEMSTLLGLEKPPYHIRKYKRLYGRCSRQGDLAFNTYLYQENYRFIDYVVLHECAHLIEFNHSKAFYGLIEKIMPDYKAVIASRMSGRDLHLDQ